MAEGFPTPPFPCSFFLDAGGSGLFGTNERIKRKEMAVPTSAHEMGVDSRRAGDGMCVPKVPGAEQGQQTYSKMQRIHFIPITLIKIPQQKQPVGRTGLFWLTVPEGYSPLWQGRNGNRSMRQHIMSADLKEVEPAYKTSRLTPVTYFLQPGSTSLRSHNLPKQCHRLRAKCSNP